MRTLAPVWEDTLNFDALGRTLRYFAGRRVRLEVLALPPGQPVGDHALVIGVAEGRLALYDGPVPPDESPPGAVEPGELAHLIAIGRAWFPISGVDLTGASSDGGILDWQVGPVLFHMTIDTEA